MNIKRFNGNDFPGDKWVRDILSRVNEIIDYLKRKVGFDRLSDEVTEVLTPLTSVGTDGQVLTSDGKTARWGALPTATATSMGLTKQNRIQSKSSASSYGSNASGIITFSNLTIGRTYRITAGVIRALRTASGGYAYVEAKHNSASLFGGFGAGVADAGATTESAEVVTGVSRSAVFVAAATSVSIDAVVSNGSIESSFATLEELNNYEVTTDW